MQGEGAKSWEERRRAYVEIHKRYDELMDQQKDGKMDRLMIEQVSLIKCY